MKCLNCGKDELYQFTTYWLNTHRKITKDNKISKKVFHKDIEEYVGEYISDGLQCSSCKTVFRYELNDDEQIINISYS